LNKQKWRKHAETAQNRLTANVCFGGHLLAAIVLKGFYQLR